jgi:hypothetical protein
MNIAMWILVGGIVGWAGFSYLNLQPLWRVTARRRTGP